jgi:hypothetical protein
MKSSDKFKLLTKKGKVSKADLAEHKKVSKSDFDKQLFALMKVKPPKKDN